MEIQKIFSEVDTDERLYSVLLTEDEVALFSEVMDKIHISEIENNKENKKRSLKRAQKAGLVAGSISGGILGGFGGGLASGSLKGAAIGAAGAGLLVNRYMNKKNRKNIKKYLRDQKMITVSIKKTITILMNKRKKELRDKFENSKSLALQRDANRLLRNQIHQQRMIKYNLYMR